MEQAITVKELTLHIKRWLEENPQLNNVWVRGEISNFTHHSRGHMYFTLKDESSRIRSVMFKGNNQFLKFNPKEGMKVLARGDVNVYERDGQYQLYVREMQPDGIGALYQAYEELKEALANRGWFDEHLKKDIPAFPVRIGVITSPTGAAVRDIITTIKRRFPIVEVCVFPVLVQGEQAAASIAKAIKLAEKQSFDVLIVGRGGGSIEELWAFNEEVVAEAIYGSSIPIISAVGHETDFTIADFVADLRAPTPTAAAEMAVPLLNELNDDIKRLEQQLKRTMMRLIADQEQRLRRLQSSYAFKYPQTLMDQKEQQLDQTIQQLTRSMNRFVNYKKERLQTIQHQLNQAHPKSQYILSVKDYKRLQTAFGKAMSQIVKNYEQTLQLQMSKLDAYSPLKIMSKGYSLVYNDEKDVLYKSVHDIQPGQAISVRMADGELDCNVWSVKEGTKQNG